MASFYDIMLTSNIPHGSDILNKPCTVVFTYPDGSRTDRPYNGQILASFTPNTVRISSANPSIENGWARADGGSLAIRSNTTLTYGISSFARVS
jgi:hypothetical protein